MVTWDRVTDADVLRAIQEYDRLGPERFFAAHGFGPTTTYDLVWDEHRYPPKAILGAAYEFATGQRLAAGDFEGGKTGAVAVLGKLGFTVQHKQRPAGEVLYTSTAGRASGWVRAGTAAEGARPGSTTAGRDHRERPQGLRRAEGALGQAACPPPVISSAPNQASRISSTATHGGHGRPQGPGH